MSRVCLILFGICAGFSSVAQNSIDSHWLFGPNSFILDFNSGNGSFSASPQNKLPLTGTEGNSSVIDPLSKNVLFYTDGISVIDKDFLVMPNGSGLNGFTSSSQSGLICPVQGSCTQYYVFSNNCSYDFNPNSIATGSLYYSKVDLSLPGNGTTTHPSGDVMTGQKNILLHSTVCEAAVIINDSLNNAHSWMVTYNPNANSFLVFEITATNISLSSTYNLPFTYWRPLSMIYNYRNGKIAVSSHISSEAVLLVDFNSGTGNITGHATIPGTPFGAYTPWAGVYGLEWSFSGNKLYIGRYRVNATNGPGGQLYQYNLLSPAVPPVLIYQVSNNAAHTISGLKRASNGKIYMIYRSLQTGNAQQIGIIDQPENTGNSCAFSPSVFVFPSDPGNINRFPEFIEGKPIELKIENQTKSISCLIDSVYEVIFQHPVFYDTSSSLSYAITYAGAAGNATLGPDGNSILYPYTAGITIIDSVQIGICDNRCLMVCDTFSVLINTVNQPDQYYSIDTCSTDSLMLVPQSASNNITSQIWSTGETDSFISVSQSGIYNHTVYTGSCSEFFSYTVTFLEEPDTILIPNVFSPNRDGKNDTYYISGVDAEDYSLAIYNRWGNRVFYSTNDEEKWDGTFNKDAVAGGTYYVILGYKPKCSPGPAVQKNYFITVFR